MPQVVLTRAPQGASSNTHECPSGCPFGCPKRCPRVPRSVGAALGTPVPRWAARAMPGGRREVEPGWGNIPPLGKERQKERSRPKKAPRRQPAGPRLLPKPKIPPQCLRAAGCPARLFGGSPLPLGGRGCPLPQLYFTRSPDSRFRFAAADTHRECTRAASRGRALPLCPPPRPLAPHDPPEPPLASLVLHDI